MVESVKVMNRVRPARNPTFFWHGVFIVLPVVALAAVGLFSLRQDKILVQHEAVERAQVLAGDLALQIWIELTTRFDADAGNAFLVSRSGQLLEPPPIVQLPVPQPLVPA